MDLRTLRTQNQIPCSYFVTIPRVRILSYNSILPTSENFTQQESLPASKMRLMFVCVQFARVKRCCVLSIHGCTKLTPGEVPGLVRKAFMMMVDSVPRGWLHIEPGGTTHCSLLMVSVPSSPGDAGELACGRGGGEGCSDGGCGWSG